MYTTEYYSTIKNEIMHLQHHGWSQRLSYQVREGQTSHDIIYVWNLKKKMIEMNLFTKQKQTQRENKLTVTKRERWGGINQEFWINRYILLRIKQITNKDLLYSTGNYIQYCIITYNGKESGKGIYICTTESPCYIPKTL